MTNVRASVADSATQTDLDASESVLLSAWGVTIVSFFFNFLGLFGGFTMFMNNINLLQIVAHVLGGITTSLFLLDGWHVAAYWWITAFCSLLPALAEMFVLVSVFGCKMIVY